MMRRPLAPIAALTCALTFATACQSGAETPVDRSPLPVAATPPYICDHIPLKAVERMTGVRDPLVRGYFDLTTTSGLGTGSCAVYRRDGEQSKVLLIRLTPGGYPGGIEEYLEDGASRLPEIFPGSIGAYFKAENSENNSAYAHLVRGKAWLSVQLEIGVKGRDNAADVAAMMKLIAPKLLTDASAPSTSPSAKVSSPSPAKD